jgi:hypothetical protein
VGSSLATLAPGGLLLVVMASLTLALLGAAGLGRHRSRRTE